MMNSGPFCNFVVLVKVVPKSLSALSPGGKTPPYASELTVKYYIVTSTFAPPP
jgi:hypothetical protein